MIFHSEDAMYGCSSFSRRRRARGKAITCPLRLDWLTSGLMRRTDAEHIAGEILLKAENGILCCRGGKV